MPPTPSTSRVAPASLAVSLITLTCFAPMAFIISKPCFFSSADAVLSCSRASLGMYATRSSTLLAFSKAAAYSR
jgi:hypothetical protein